MRQWLSGTPAVLMLLVVATLVVGWLGLRALESAMQEELSSRLASDLDASVVSLDLWLQDQRHAASVWADETQVREVAAALSRQGKDKDDSVPQDTARESAKLHTVLSPVC